jgi:hypothetical protein
MKKTEYLNELLNSGIELNEKETELVEQYIASKSKPVKAAHLNEYKCVAAARGMGKSTGV